MIRLNHQQSHGNHTLESKTAKASANVHNVGVQGV